MQPAAVTASLPPARGNKPTISEASPLKPAPRDRSFAEWLPLLPAHLTELLSSLEDYVLSLGDDVQRKELRLYLAFKRLKSFAVVAQKSRLLLYLHLNPVDLAWGRCPLSVAMSANRDIGVRVTWNCP